MGYLICLLCAAIFSLSLISPVKTNTHHKQFIETLLDLISDQQTKTEQPLILFKQWHRMKGSYNNEIKWNLHGSVDKALARHLLGVYDNNFFATTYVLISLLDAMKYGNIPTPSHDDLSQAIQYLGNFHDNKTSSTSSDIMYWPRTYDHSANVWRSNIDNLKVFMKTLNEFPEPQIEQVLKINGFQGLADEVKNFEDYANRLENFFELLIPADVDDSVCNLGLGASLYQLRDQLPEEWTLWRDQNTDMLLTFDTIKSVVYRPFSDDPNINTIDPRSYYYMRKFLDKAKNAGEDIALPTVWMWTIDELRQPYIMNLSVVYTGNDVDICVMGNFVYGITSMILYGLASPDLLLSDPLLEQMYLNSTSLIRFAIQTNFSGHPDAAQLFYSSPICQYLITRTFFILETARQQGPLPVPVMETAYNIFKDVTMNDVTDDILSKVKAEDDKFYLDDFIGNDDITKDNMPLNRGDDRTFSTGVSANTLLNIWSIYDETSKTSRWRPDTPASVKTVVTGFVKWLIEHTLDGTYNLDNPFITVSMKYYWGLPTWFPANRFEYLNGTAIEDRSTLPNKAFLYGVTGYIEPDDYDAMLEEPHFGFKTKQTFDGYNNNPIDFVYWSSLPYAYSHILLAVSRFDNIIK